MPRRSSAEYHHDHQSGHAGGAHHPGRRRPADYTLVHAGRRLRVGPIVFWIVVGTLMIMAVWSITTATYFAFREDVLTRLVARQADMQSGYEDRIAELRAQIDRISGRQLLDQEQYEQKLDQILRRQSALESRAGALNGLGDAPSPARQPGRGGASGERAAPLKGSLIKDKGVFVQPDRTVPVDPRTSMFLASAGGLSGVITRLNGSLDRVEQRQSATVNSLADTYDAKARRMRGVLAELGVDVGKPAPGAAGEVVVAMGGPFVPLPVAKDAMSFERQVHRVKLARAQIARFTRTLGTLPVRKPVDGEIELMSGFGVRMDPFTGSPAMHTGLDLHGETGNPVRATADGTVTTAGWGGGYGRVVDIDHGNGLATRYGHLSAIDVRAGQSVKAGQIIGRVGSTGRSTGPHLHYETRLRKEAVDPQKFLRAGQRLDTSL